MTRRFVTALALSLVLSLGAAYASVDTTWMDQYECGLNDITDGNERRQAYIKAARKFCRVEDFQSFSAGQSFELLGTGSRYLVANKHELVIAVNPKVMSSTSKMLISALDGLNQKVAWNVSAFQFLSQRDDRDALLQRAHRILFIRNPWTRLFSAWGEKFKVMSKVCDETHCASGARMWYYMAKTIHYRYNITLPESKVAVMQGITWPIFLRAVLDGVAHDRHWKPQVDETHLCKFAPTFIAALEHSDEDVIALLKHIGEDPDHLDFVSANRKADGNKKDWGRLYPESLRPAFMKAYKHDFEAFGYAKNVSCA